jgi:hypothetical protein
MGMGMGMGMDMGMGMGMGMGVTAAMGMEADRAMGLMQRQLRNGNVWAMGWSLHRSQPTKSLLAGTANA